MTKLIRGLSLPQAVAINTIDMVGIGPFVAMPFIIGAMNGPASIFAWVLGAALAFADGAVWAELGAKWPEAGGSYAFLRRLYDGMGIGKLFSFLYTWQTMIFGPLVIASGAIGFAQYSTYLVPVSLWEQKAISGAVVIIITLLLYRKITGVGKISLILGLFVFGSIIWIIVAGLTHFNPINPNAFSGLSQSGFGAENLSGGHINEAMTKAIYCYLGYYNVCHVGGEIKNPGKNIPLSIFISIAIIAVLYILMQTAILSVIPWQEAKNSTFIVSLYFEKLYGPGAAQFATAIVLLIALSSLFAVLLGYSRVPYAAAADNNFPAWFGKLHPGKNFPHISLLAMAALAFIFSLLFKMKEIITAIIVMRIIVQFVAQGIGLLFYHAKHKNGSFPFRMWLYPIPLLLALIAWLFIFFSSPVRLMAGAGILIAAGVILFYGMQWRERRIYQGRR